MLGGDFGYIDIAECRYYHIIVIMYHLKALMIKIIYCTTTFYDIVTFFRPIKLNELRAPKVIPLPCQ